MSPKRDRAETDQEPESSAEPVATRLDRTYVFHYVNGDGRLPAIAWQPRRGGLLEAIGTPHGGACIIIDQNDSEGPAKLAFMRDYVKRADVRCKFEEMPAKPETKETA